MCSELPAGCYGVLSGDYNVARWLLGSSVWFMSEAVIGVF